MWGPLLAVACVLLSAPTAALRLTRGEALRSLSTDAHEGAAAWVGERASLACLPVAAAGERGSCVSAGAPRGSLRPSLLPRGSYRLSYRFSLWP